MPESDPQDEEQRDHGPDPTEPVPIEPDRIEPGTTEPGATEPRPVEADPEVTEQDVPGWGWSPPQWGPPPAQHWPPPPPGWRWPGPPGPPPRRRGRAVVALVLAALVLVASGIGIGWGLTTGRAHNATGRSVPAPGNVPVRPGEDGGDGSQPGSETVSGIDVEAVTGEVDPAMVNIDTEIGTAIPGTSGGLLGRAAGTGMILTSGGLVLTNNHVIRGATSIEVTIQGRSGTATANVVGVAPAADVALLQIDGVSGLPTITAADTSNLTVGQPVVAIGNAYGEGGEPASAAGNITALEQTITARDSGSDAERLSGLIEADTPIAPGESGGALADARGDVVGMITAASRFAPYSQPSTDAYAISIEDALSIVDRIRSGDATAQIIIGPTGFLGVQIRDLTEAAASRLGLHATAGALVVNALAGGPAAGAGMRSGSAITRIDGTAIDSPETLGTVLHGTKPGQAVSVTWEDGSGTHTATITLITAPAV